MYFKKVKMGCSFIKMGRMDATLFVHAAQQMDCNLKKKIKWTVNSEKMGWDFLDTINGPHWREIIYSPNPANGLYILENMG